MDLTPARRWEPVDELPPDLQQHQSPSLVGLAQAWREEREATRELQVEPVFLDRWPWLPGCTTGSRRSTRSRTATVGWPVSFTAVGSARGTLAAVVGALESSTGGDAGQLTRRVHVVSQEPFTATSREQTSEVLKRFRDWLRTDVARALALWQRGL